MTWLVFGGTPMTPELKRTVSEYLRDVARVMRAGGHDDSEIEVVIAALEEQIAERARRDPDFAATPATLLARLEPVDAFAATSSSGETPGSAARGLGRRGRQSFAAGIAGGGLVLAISVLFWSVWPAAPERGASRAPAASGSHALRSTPSSDTAGDILRGTLIAPERDWAYTIRLPSGVVAPGSRQLIVIDPGGNADPASLSVPGYDGARWVLVQPDRLEPGWTIDPETPPAVLDAIAIEVAERLEIEPFETVHIEP